MNKKPLIIVIAVLILLGFTNPSKEQYVLWAKNKLIEQSEDKGIGALVSLFAPALIDGTTSITNFMMFSTFTTKFDDKEYITLGVLNKFITLHKGIKDIPEKKVKEVPNTVSISQPAQQSVDVSGRKPGADNFKTSNMDVMVLVLLILKILHRISPLLTVTDLNLFLLMDKLALLLMAVITPILTY